MGKSILPGDMSLAHAVENRVVAPRNLRRYLAQIAIVFALQFAAGKLGDVLQTINSGGIGPVWPASGIALGALLLWGYSVWPGIAAGAFLLAFLSPLPHWAAAAYAAGTTLAALIAAFLLHTIANFRPSLSRLRDVLGLILFGALCSATVSASIGASILYAGHVRGWSGFGRAWLIYWLGDAMGVLLITPVMLTFRDSLKVRSWSRIAEFVAVLFLLTMVCFIIFGDLPLIPIRLHILAFAVLPFVIWAAIRFGLSGAGLATLSIALIATIETAFGSGPFATNTPLMNAVLLDVFFGVLSVTGLTLAAVCVEREQLLGQKAAMETQLRADEAVRESEDKLRLILDSTAEAIYGIDLEHRCTFCNPACVRTLGYERVDELLGKNMHNLIHHTRSDGTLFPVEECRVHRVTRTGEGVHAEDELMWRANGTSFPTEYWSYPQRRGNDIVGAVVAFVDITEHKLAEAALENVSRKLIEAQEQERTRIARELHDDIGQRLALLTVELKHIQENSPDFPAEVSVRIAELGMQTSEIARDVQSMSHNLHSSKLEYLGIATAMRGFCKEFSEQQGVEIVFAHDDIPSKLPEDISLCLFRVLQEALQNAVKHSGVRHFDVELRYASDAIDFTVRDSGSGFDIDQAMKTRGLGLTSMAERLKLVDGQLSIDSQPKRGTTIHARVPLSSGRNSMHATG